VDAQVASAQRRGAVQDQSAALDPRCLSDFGRRLRAWYRRSARDLPWRRTRNAYRVLISELMLQQTQVSRVIPKYHEFLRAFPSLSSVARAEPARVLEAWSGLGYYARARNLHKLARVLTSDGARSRVRLPSEPAALRGLPGIGAYTAGAVASFAYEVRTPLVDTNVARVLSRVFAPSLSPKRPRDLKRIWAIAERSLPRTGNATWTHNQALMELGAVLCTARVAHCDRCPVSSLCATRARAMTLRGVI
jgi:A/G-specific adenine glycosylase